MRDTFVKFKSFVLIGANLSSMRDLHDFCNVLRELFRIFGHLIHKDSQSKCKRP